MPLDEAKGGQLPIERDVSDSHSPVGEKRDVKAGTDYDKRDMTRMGKRQELRVSSLACRTARSTTTDG